MSIKSVKSRRKNVCVSYVIGNVEIRAAVNELKFSFFVLKAGR